MSLVCCHPSPPLSSCRGISLSDPGSAMSFRCLIAMVVDLLPQPPLIPLPNSTDHQSHRVDLLSEAFFMGWMHDIAIARMTTDHSPCAQPK